MVRGHRLWFIVLALITLNACSQGPYYQGADRQDSFGQRQRALGTIDPAAPGFADGLLDRRLSSLHSHDLGPMPRWQKVMARFAQQEHSSDLGCAAGANCPAETWKRVVAELKTLPLRARVERVNDIFNRVPYVPAELNWHDVAYWETPYEFLARGGQCQDYAIAKFLALLKSGVPEQYLQFLVVHDNNLQLDHAITVVDVDGDSLALDNQIPSVVPIQSLRLRYSPYYALNDEGWWPYMSSEIGQVAWQPPATNTAALFVSSFHVARY